MFKQTENSYHQNPPAVSSHEVTLHISGLKCASCASIIDETLKNINGVIASNTSYATDTCKIEYDPSKISKKTFLAQIKNLGYTASEFFGDENFKTEQRKTLIRFGIAALISMNIMMMTVPLYWDYFEPMDSHVVSLFGWLMFILSIPVLFITGMPVMKKAVTSIFRGHPGMETLIGIGAGAAFIYSTFQLVFVPNPHLYYDTATSLIVIILFGKFVENFFRYKASGAINRLYSVLPKKIRTRDLMHNIKWVAADELKAGSVFEVHTGETIAADGEVVGGTANVDESMFTGEAKGVVKNIGSKVYSGCIVKSGYLHIKATETAKNSALSIIVKWIEDSLQKKSMLQSFSDKVARYFVPAIFLLSALTLVAMLYFGLNFETSFLRALTVMVIACPCALAIAVPVTIVTSLGTLAKNGIFIRNPDVLQHLRKVKDVVFDKTGTLTYGKFSVLGYKNMIESEKVENILREMETYSSHPVAEAIKEYFEGKYDKVKIENVSVVREGIIGTYNSQQWTIGSEELFSSDKYDLKADSQKQRLNGHTVVYFGRDSIIEGYIWIGDSAREKVTNLISSLSTIGKKVHIISGDKTTTTENFARNVGIDIFFGETSPKEKIDYIKELKNQAQNKTVMMIGDGINDAAALAEADVGIALSSGTDLAKASSSIIIFKNFLDKIPLLINYAKRINTITLQNFSWAVVYNIVGVGLAISGVLNPLIAAIMMMLSSITVVVNSLRLVVFK